MPRTITAKQVQSWGEFSIQGKYILVDGEDKKTRGFKTPASHCRQTSAYDMGRELKEAINGAFVHPPLLNRRRVKAFLLSKSGRPLSSGLKILQYLHLNYMDYRRNHWIPRDDLLDYERPYQFQKDFMERLGSASGRNQILEVLQVIFVLFNVMVHGPTYKPKNPPVKLIYQKTKNRVVVSWTGSNAFIVNRTLLHGLYGVLRDAINFAGTGYTVEDMGLDTTKVFAALETKNKRLLRAMARTMVDALGKFRKGRANSPFSTGPIARMYFMIEEWGGIDLHSYSMKALRREEVLLSINPDHNDVRGRLPVHTKEEGNFLPNWTTKDLAFRLWWENDAKFTSKFEIKFQKWLEENKAKISP